MFNRAKIAVGVAFMLAGTAGVADAAPFTLTFERIADYPNDSTALVEEFYNGGTSSIGTTGTNYGVSFGSAATLLCLNTVGTTCSNTSRGGFGDPGSQNGALTFAGGTVEGFANIAAGFTGKLAFVYSTDDLPGHVNVYSGLDGTGAILGTVAMSDNFTGSCVGFETDFCPFTAASISFAGTAHSVGFSGGTYVPRIDDLTFGGSDVPEPAAWALMVAGFGLVGATMRRRDRVAVAA